MPADLDLIVGRLRARTAEHVRLCSDLVRAPSPNPPGDTLAPARVVQEALRADGIEFEILASRPEMPNIVATVRGDAAGPHVVLCGHLDTYPAGTGWDRDAFSGHAEGERLHGRGSGDMKSGLTTLIATLRAFHEVGSFPGTVTLLAVSDEMSFSPHGAPFVLDQRPDLVGDAVIAAEPTSPDFVLFGEKGMCWVELTCAGEPAAAAFATTQRNAIETYGRVFAEIATLRSGPRALPAEITAALALGGTSGLPEEALTYADDRVLSLVTVNAGTVAGGSKTNLVADHCVGTVDIRVPPGSTLDVVRDHLDAVVARHPGSSYRVIQAMEPNWTDPGSALVRALIEGAEAAGGVRPRPEIGITASDTRLWRARGKPAAMIGPRIAGQGMPNESIATADLALCAEAITRATCSVLSS